MATKKPKRRETFGMIDKLPSGRYRARYSAPDGKRYSAPMTFSTLTDARAWLAARQTEISRGEWVPPRVAAAHAARKAITLDAYSKTWMQTRTNSKGDALRPRTREEYERLLGDALAPLATRSLPEITPDVVRTWRAEIIASGRKTTAAHSYTLLKAIMATAVDDGLISSNPCSIKGAAATRTGKYVAPPTDAELDVLLNEIDPRYTALVVIAAIGGLRYGEATALQASDVSIERDDNGQVRAVRIAVTKGVVAVGGRFEVGPPKSEAGIRTVAIFGEDAEVIAQHMADLEPESLLFPAMNGGYLRQSTFTRYWYPARAAAGRTDLPFHGLRHYAGTRYAQAGATPKETMARLGHSSIGAAMRYQHAGSRDDELAARLNRRG